MLTGRAGCSHPHAIKQAREDFKIYMSKLLEHSAALGAFRQGEGRQQLERRPGHNSPARGSRVGPPETAGSEGTRASSPAGTRSNLPSPPVSPRTFGEQWSWPRAGAVTPPR
ncbi:unnamed protein product, partial [Ascophyllum nodosum]